MENGTNIPDIMKKGDIPDIKIEDLRFSYNGLEVIKGLDLEAGRGAFVGFLGPNGSGKTTLVKLLSKVLEADSGTIELMGEPIRKWNPRRLAQQVAVVPQSTHVAFPFSALEVVLMGRAPHLGGLAFESDDDMEIAAKAMKQTDTWELRHRSMQQLSGGEAQRVIVARALAQKPQILLLDEPTLHLDIKHQIALMDLLLRLNREEGLTVLTVSHDLNLIARYADRMVLLKNGSIYADGTPGEVLTVENVREVYEARVEIIDVHGRPGIFPAVENNGGDR